jgi:DNA-binding Xre family transcriptional regulator
MYYEDMVVKIIIREIAESKGIANPSQLKRATGLNYAQCHLYWNSQPKQIGVDALNRLCMALKVTPGQLFEFAPEPNWQKTVKSVKGVKSSKRKTTRK